MASPRPRTVVRFTAKTETGVIPSSTRRESRVPITATAPMVSGMAAATSEPKTKSNKMSVSGTAKASARSRSCSTTLFTSWKADANPPTWTSIGPEGCATAAAMAGSRRVIWSWSPTIRPITNALVALFVRRTGMASRLQYDCTFAMWGWAARSRVSARPAAATARAVHRPAARRGRGG